MPYVCGEPQEPTTTSPPTPTTTAPGLPEAADTGNGPQVGAHAPTDIPAAGNTPIVAVPGQPSSANSAAPTSSPVPGTRASGLQALGQSPTGPDDTGLRSLTSCRSGGGSFADLFCGAKHYACAISCSNYDAIEETLINGNDLTGKYAEDFKQKFRQFKDQGYSDEQLFQIGTGLAQEQVERDRTEQFNEWRAGTKNKACEDYPRLVDNDGKCRGPVAVCPPKDGETPQEVQQRLDYIGRANATITEPLVRVPTNGRLREAANKTAAAERKAHPEKYEGGLVAGHVPDTTWGGNAVPPGGFLPMTSRLNSSIGGQAGAYPVGYKASRFVFGQWVNGRCLAVTG